MNPESLFNGPLARLLRSEGVAPDPWPPEVDAAARSADAVPLCCHCFFPQGPHRHFCPNCGSPTGDHVALVEYLNVFVIGELMRRGVSGPPEERLGVQAFLAVVAMTQYAVFAPLYWFWMWRRSCGRPIAALHPTWDPHADDAGDHSAADH